MGGHSLFPPNTAFRENSFLTSTGKHDQDIMIGEAQAAISVQPREEKDRVPRRHGPSDLRCLLLVASNLRKSDLR